MSLNECALCKSNVRLVFEQKKKIKGNNNKNKIWFHCDSVCEYMYICPSNNTYSIHFRIANSHSHHSIQLLENSKNVYFEYFSTFGYAEYFRSVFLCLSVFALFLYLFFFLFNTLSRIDIESSIHNKCICAHICVNKLFFCTRIVRSAYFKLHQWIYFFSVFVGFCYVHKWKLSYCFSIAFHYNQVTFDTRTHASNRCDMIFVQKNELTW